MKLLFVHQNLGEFGGAEAYVELAARELRKRGHRSDLLFQHGTGRAEEEWQSSFDSCFGLPAHPHAEWFEALMEQARPDLIFLHNFSDLETIKQLLDSKIPCVKMVHDHALYCLRTYKYNYFTREICHRPLSGYCAFPCLATLSRDRESLLGVKWASLSAKQQELDLTRRCAALLTYSEYQKQELIRNGFEPAKIFLSSPMRAHGEEAASSFTDRNLILFAGQIIRGKGVDALLRALAKLERPFECIILGQGSHRKYCEKLSHKLGLEGKVKFEGYVLPARLRDYYAEATVFAMSSLWPEPFGMAGPEAMRYGLPVVTFDSGGIKEWLQDGENGFLVPWNDTGAFAHRLDQLLADKGLARELGRQARESVRRLEADRQINQLEVILNSFRPASASVDTPAANQPAPMVPNTLCL